MTDLTDYGGGSERPEPDVRRMKIVWSPTSPGKPAGFMGTDHASGYSVYTSRRKDYHFYRRGGGYAISTSILARLEGNDITRILFHEADSGHVYEFPTRQYVDGEAVPTDDWLDADDPQKYVPLDEYLHRWRGYGDEMFQRDFKSAMDFSVNRYGWDERDGGDER